MIFDIRVLLGFFPNECFLLRAQSYILLYSFLFQELSTLYHWQYLTVFKTIKLAGNQLKTLRFVHVLQDVASLNLDGNQISSLDGVSKLPFLQEFSIQRNCILSS